MDEKQLIENLKQEHQTKNQEGYPSETVTLPSKGYFYSEEHPFATGEVELKYPTAREEDILTSKNLITKGLAIDTFLKAVILTPVDYDSIFLGDKNGIMFASRILAYGTDYPVKLKCPSCQEQISLNIDLSNLSAKEIDFEKYLKGISEFEVDLPNSKKRIKYKILTSGDESALTEEIKRTKKKIAGSGDAEVTTRLKYAIISIDGDTSRANVAKFVDSMLSRDSLFLRGEIVNTSPDIESIFDFVCPECGHSDELNVPMEISFFWPSGKL